MESILERIWPLWYGRCWNYTKSRIEFVMSNNLEAAPEEDEPNNEVDNGECFGEIDTTIQKVFHIFLSSFLFVTNKNFSFGKL